MIKFFLLLFLLQLPGPYGITLPMPLPVHSKKKQQPVNHPPLVKIILPLNKERFTGNSLVHYTILVSDQEDGESKFDEINPREVMLKVKRVNGTIKTSGPENGKVQNDAPGLASILLSNCFNCHQSSARSIGPSFSAIQKKYRPNSTLINLLAKRILKGSSGVWGRTSMPSHPELSIDETTNIVKWILKYGAQQGVEYYTGTDGSFRTQPPAKPGQKGAYILTAIYYDHGVKDEPSIPRLKGQDVVVIRNK